MNNLLNMAKRTYIQDKATIRAKNEGFKARSVFKLEEIDKKYKLVKNGQSVLDIGSSPGSFIQYLRKNNTTGKIIGLDITELPDFKNPLQNPFTQTFVADLLSPQDEVEEGIEKIWSDNFEGTPKFDLIISDAMGKTTGFGFLDHEESIDIVMRVIEIGDKYLKKDGNLIAKFFMGNRHKELLEKSKKLYKDVKIEKPDVSNRSKKEFFIICLGKK